MKDLGLAALQWYVRRFPISKGKGRLVSWLWKPLAGGNWQRQTVLRQADVQVACDLSKLLQRHLYFWGGYEEGSCAHWLRLARESTTIFDIGANVGLYSLLASRANPQSKVYAFEPAVEVSAILQRNVELNGMQNISVVLAAVGDSDRTGFLRLCAGSDGSNEGMNYLSRHKTNESDLPVAVVSLDSYCHSHNIEQIDLMKMDIEGGEYEALLGAQELLRRRAIGCIFLEMAEWAAKRSGHSTQEIERLLVDAGYRLFTPGLRGLVPMALEATTRPENVIAFLREPGHWRGQKESGGMEAGPWQLR